MIKPYINDIRDKKPRISCITNPVSANLCANGLLACGALPIMAEAIEEVEEISAQCQGLCLNLGVPSTQKVEAMIKAGKVANEKGIPVVFDPVGVGASSFRMELAQKILSSMQITMIRGNMSEIKTLVTGICSHSGVDVQEEDRILGENLEEKVELAKQGAKLTKAIVAISGDVDVITDGIRTYTVRNGHPMMSKVTGSGCLLSALSTAFLAVNSKEKLEAVVASFSMIGICGEKASIAPASGSYGVEFIDAIYSFGNEEWEGEAKYEIF